MVAAHDLNEILDRLSGLDDVISRPMFGGYGLYWRGIIFAMAHRGRLYFKVDEQSKPAFEALGMGPFRPNERQTLKSYYEMPPEVLDDPDVLLSWAGEAIRAAPP